MKKVFILLAITVLISVNVKSQSVCALGNFIIEQDDFAIAKGQLARSGFTLFSAQELEAFGHNPSTIIIGTKGSNQSNSIMANIAAISTKDSRIKEATFICSKSYAMYIESDLADTGYKKKNEREYVENNRFKVKEITYERFLSDSKNVDVAIIKFTPDGSAQITFKVKRTLR